MSEYVSATGFIAPDPLDLAPLFPEYQIEHLIATGGMGAVYRAVQTALDRTVAIKILPHEFSNDAEFCQSFESEAKAMARLNHPNLIGVFDFGEVNGMLFIVMEYVAGQSLYAAANGHAIDSTEVIRLISGIANGLAHAHEHGILHRDIKPANILLDSKAQPKIGDFGLARPADVQIHEGEAIFGTPHYTAPEVLVPPHTVDHRADIFSLGVMLHELLTGKLPAEDPRTPSAIAQCDPRFDAVVRKATATNPNHRYNSAYEIAQELHIIATTAGPRVLNTAAAPAGSALQVKKSYQVKSKKFGPGKFVFLLLLLGLLYVGYSRRDEILILIQPYIQPILKSQKQAPDSQTTPVGSQPMVLEAVSPGIDSPAQAAPEVLEPQAAELNEAPAEP